MYAVKYLGITIDSSAEYREHIDAVVQKAVHAFFGNARVAKFEWGIPYVSEAFVQSNSGANRHLWRRYMGS